MPPLTLHLAGPLRLVDDTGADRTPRGARARGVLALLGASPGHRRPRLWLQDKLWSEKEHEAGAANLRQCLSELRRDLGPWRDVLVSEPGFLALDHALVAVRLAASPGSWSFDGQPPQFAEGLDVADPEFDDWLRDQRSAFDERLDAGHGDQSAPRPTLLLARPEASCPTLAAAAESLSEDIGVFVTQFCGAEAVLETFSRFELPPLTAIRLHVRASNYGGGTAMFRVALVDPSRGVSLWASHALVKMAALQERGGAVFAALASAAAAATAENLARLPGNCADGVGDGLRALGLLKSVTPEALERSDRLFARAHEATGASTFLAWRAYISHLRGIERLDPADKDAAALSVDRARAALRDDPLNPVIMAIAAEIEAVSGAGPGAAAALAAAARAAAPGNAYALASHAYVLSLRGEHGRAYAEALAARRLAHGHGDRFHWDMLCCLAALRTGRIADAVVHAELASTRDRNYKPPLRYLAPLRLATGDEAGAVAALSALRRVEPDFSLDRYEDAAYPTASLRGTPLMAITRSGLI